MRLLARLFLLCAVLTVAACASPDKIWRTRGLSSQADFSRVDPKWSGTFAGIDSIRKSSTSRNINILFVHGIGWTQEDGDAPPFGFDLASAVSQAYGVTNEDWRLAKDVCPRSTLNEQRDLPAQEKVANAPRGLTISNVHTPVFSTDDPVLKVYSTDFGCLDRLKVNTPEGTISIYRFFWDDALWNSIEWFHTGYDDRFPKKSDGTKYVLPGYDDVESMRARGTAKLKDQVLTWGLVDAAAYIGPAGPLAREGVRGAICAVINSQENLLDGAQPPDRQNVARRTAADLCAVKNEKVDPLIVMAHSLGSRVVFDVLNSDLETSLAERLNTLPNDTLEVYLLANQIPLVATGRIFDASEPRNPGRRLVRTTKKLTFVAFSEINDILTYELVPYFEHMYYLRCHGYQSPEKPGPSAGCTVPYDKNYYLAQQQFASDTNGRAELVNALGFDVVDVRVSFAPAIPILDLVRPDQAHQGYLTRSKKVRSLLFCGLAEGVAKTCAVKQ
jgi:hypothetical protein